MSVAVAHTRTIGLSIAITLACTIFLSISITTARTILRSLTVAFAGTIDCIGCTAGTENILGCAVCTSTIASVTNLTIGAENIIARVFFSTATDLAPVLIRIEPIFTI